jgi:single-strand DNA-binding protein
MSGINKVILVGNLGKDPEVRHLEGGAVVAKFPLATSESYKTKDGQKMEQTEWHNIVMWRGLAESAEKYLRKGALVYIEGKIRTRSWDDKEGNKRYSTEIVADTMTMLGGRRPDDNSGSGNGDSRNSSSDHSSGTAASGTHGQGSGDDLPF